jgi:replicative DNA helicase
VLFNIEAEQYLLGCLFNEPDLIKEVTLRPEHFYSTNHQVIFQAMREAEKREQPTDLITVFSMIPKDKKQEIGAEYINNLAASIPTVENFKHYEQMILKTWKVRRAIQIANQLSMDLQQGLYLDDAQANISNAIQKLTRLEEVGYETDFDIKRALLELIKSMHEDQKGITTGYKDLNAYTNGWKDGDLIVIGGRPSMGKTAFALNLGMNACKSDVVVSIFSLEMSEDLLMKRIICSEARIDAQKMRNPKAHFNDQDWERNAYTVGIIEKLPLNIYDNPSVTVQEIRAKVRQLRRKYPDKKHLCIIDYLTLIQSGENRENRTLEVGAISRSLKIMARELHLPVIVLSQLSRGVEQRNNKRPMLSDLRESGNIEQDADVIIFLYRDDYYNPNSEKKNVVEVIIAKQRNGPTGTIELGYLKEFNKFVELARDR